MDNYDLLWNVYNDPQYRDQVEKWLPETLPDLDWKTQVAVLEGAPLEVIEAHAELLDERARKKLGLAETFAWAKLV